MEKYNNQPQPSKAVEVKALVVMAELSDTDMNQVLWCCYRGVTAAVVVYQTSSD